MRGMADAHREKEKQLERQNRDASREALALAASEHATPPPAMPSPAKAMLMAKLASVDWGAAAGAVAEYAAARRARSAAPDPSAMDIPENPPEPERSLPWGHLAAAAAAVLVFVLARRG
jgi:hypothetical protein